MLSIGASLKLDISLDKLSKATWRLDSTQEQRVVIDPKGTVICIFLIRLKKMQREVGIVTTGSGVDLAT